MLKRLFDITAASVALVVFSPIMLLTAFGVWRTMGAPVLFTQKRPGLNQQPFHIYKFRSMKNATDKAGNPLSDAERLTKFGVFIRNFSLDELPQLFNILKGEMSVVGPRPLLFDFFPYYSAEEMRRHEAKPGVTGWAQVHGRNNLGWDARLKLDVWYVENQSFWLDIRIILKTVMIVLKREGVQTDGHATFLRLDDARRGAK